MFVFTQGECNYFEPYSPLPRNTTFLSISVFAFLPARNAKSPFSETCWSILNHFSEGHQTELALLQVGVLKPQVLWGYQLQIWVSPTMMPGHWQLGRAALILYHFLGDWSQFV